MKKNNDRCDINYCKQSFVLHYKGKKVCQKHWEQHCDGFLDLNEGDAQ